MDGSMSVMGAAVLAAVLLLLIWRVLTAKGQAQFDERQLLARGAAYRAGFYTMLIFLAGVYLAMNLLDWQPHDAALAAFGGMCLGVTVFACVAVVKDAYLGIRQKPKQALLMIGLVTVVNLALGAAELTRSRGFSGGMTVANSMNLVIGAMGLVILLTLAARLAADRRCGE